MRHIPGTSLLSGKVQRAVRDQEAPMRQLAYHEVYPWPFFTTMHFTAWFQLPWRSDERQGNMHSTLEKTGVNQGYFTAGLKPYRTGVRQGHSTLQPYHTGVQQGHSTSLIHRCASRSPFVCQIESTDSHASFFLYIEGWGCRGEPAP
jgi:hypothetical protein